MQSGELKVEVFFSFDDENDAEYRRRAAMSPAECMAELAALQERAWGKDWTSKPIEKVATWEELDW